MAEQLQDNKLLREYESLRQREYSVLTDLLAVLPNVDGLPAEHASQVRDALFHTDAPYLMVLMGGFNSGKSSLINALLGSPDILPVGPIPTTDRVSILRYGEQAQRMSAGALDTVMYPAPILRKLSLVDTPGLESVFTTHEQTTRNFLHRADAVMFVMLATQAMSAGSLSALKSLREHSKRLIILVNQADLLNDAEADTVRAYVEEQSRQLLGLSVPVWMVSAKRGLAAQSAGDREAWTASGLAQIEKYVDTQLDDSERLRQKLLTPLQISEAAVGQATAVLKDNQAALDQSRVIRENVRGQLASQERDQRQTVRENSQEITGRFSEAAKRGEAAIRDLFQLSRVLGQFWRGVLELFGIARLFRRGQTPNYVLNAFTQYKVLEPLTELPSVVEKLAPRLEGRDVQDIDQLVSYASREIQSLPEAIRVKIIGAPQSPVVYDRRALQAIRPALAALEEESQQLETDRFSQASRTAVIYLALWELLIVIFGVAVLASGVLAEDSQSGFIVLILLIGLAMLGLIIMPLVGRALAARYASSLFGVQQRYLEVLTRAADQQIEYGMRLRHDAAAPLTRLVDAQMDSQNHQMTRLHTIETELNRLEQDVNRLGRRSLFGIRG